MKSVTYIISHIDKAVAFEWIIDKIDSNEFDLSFILLNDNGSVIEDYIKNKGIRFYRIPFSSKKDYPKAILATRKKLKKLKSQVVHCHMRDANLIGLSAAKSLGIKKRIYTRHFSTYNHEYFPKAVKFDKLVNSMATNIVAISKNVETILIQKENVNPNKISLIHHGFDLEKFMKPNESAVQSLKEKYNPEEKWPVIGVIARYIDWKGHKYIIEAFYQILIKYPNALFVFANANGPQKNKISTWINEVLPDNSLEIQFEKDHYSLYQLFDMYVHTPINSQIEAFGQTYVEALASGVPSVFTLSGVGSEFIKDQENALVVPFQNSIELTKAIDFLLKNEETKSELIANGTKSVEKFKLSDFITKLEKLYA